MQRNKWAFQQSPNHNPYCESLIFQSLEGEEEPFSPQTATSTLLLLPNGVVL